MHAGGATEFVVYVFVCVRGGDKKKLRVRDCQTAASCVKFNQIIEWVLSFLAQVLFNDNRIKSISKVM